MEGKRDHMGDPTWATRIWQEVKYRLFWRPIYPRLQRFMHRHNLHYMTESYMHDGKLLWCHWCGARHLEPNPPLSPLTVRMQQSAADKAMASRAK